MATVTSEGLLPACFEILESRLLLSHVVLEATALRGVTNGVTIDYVEYPIPAYAGGPWSQWGKGLVASNGKVYSAVGDHKGIDGNAYIYEYDPETRLIQCVADLQEPFDPWPTGTYGLGKVHGRISEGADGMLYFASYWATTGAVPEYVGDHVFKYNPYTSVLTDLGIPQVGWGYPSTNMDTAGMVLYAEAFDKDTYPDYTVNFMAYNVLSHTVEYFGDHAGTNFGRALFVDAAGNAYFNNGGNTLQKYDAALNQLTTTYTGMPGSELRQVSTPDPNGYLYAATNDTPKLFRFDPATGAFTFLADLEYNTAALEVDPTGQYLYYMPGSHSPYADTPLIQYTLATGAKRTITNLASYIWNNYANDLGGTYNLTVSPDGRVVYVGINADKSGGTGFDNPAFIAVHIPNDGQTVFKSYPVSAPTAIGFTDVAGPTGIVAIADQYSHSAAWGDVNNDGFPDLFFGAFTSGPSRLLINNGGVSFTESVQPAINITGRASGAVFADLDNDGDQDLVVINNSNGSYPIGNKLYRNEGTGTFTDVTAASGIDFGSNFKGRNPFVLDYDGDGLLDLFIQEDYFGGSNSSRLMRNTGGLVFTNVTAAAGLSTSLVGLGGAVGDVNGDTRPDILIAYGSGGAAGNSLYINNGNGTFRLVSTAVLNSNWPTMPQDDWIAGAALGDLDRDGDMDLVIGQHWESALDHGFRVSPHVYRNDGNDGSGNPIWVDITVSSGIQPVYVKEPDVAIQDFDNDGYMDVMTSAVLKNASGVFQPILYRNRMGSTGTLTFEFYPAVDPATWDGEWVNPRYYPGAPTADFNRDGRLDIFGEEVFPATADPALFQNTGATEAFLDVSIDLGVGQPNRQGIGATVKVYEAGKAGNAAYLLGSAIIETGNGFVSGSMPIAHFGLPKYEQYAVGSNARATGGWSATRSYVDVVVTMPNSGGVYVATVATNRMVVMPGGGDINMRPSATFTADVSGAVPSNKRVDFDGTGSDDPDGVIVSYQWNFGDNTTGVGATVSHTYANLGTYTVTLTVVDNKGDSDDYSLDVMVEAPTVTDQPDNASIQEGQWASFSVTASGTAPLSYQWQSNSGGGWANLSGATGTTYQTGVLGLGDSARSFRCVVTNQLGSTASNAATVTVNQATPASVSQQPVNASVTVGRKGKFTVQVSGSWPMSYQWQENRGGGWQNVSGASGTVYDSPTTLTYWSLIATLADNGVQVRVQVTNIRGTVTSNAATLFVANSLQYAETWTGTTGTPWPSQWTKQDLDPGLTATIQSAQGELKAPVNPDSTGIALMYINTANGRDVEQKVYFNVNNNSDWAGFIARRQDTDSDTFYGVEVATSGSSIFKYVDNQKTSLLSIGNVTSGKNYWMVFRVETNASGTTDLSFKIWEDGQAVPGEWTKQVLGNNEPKLQDVSGRFGLWGRITISGSRRVRYDSYQATVELGSKNSDPTANFTAVPGTGPEPLSVHFDAASSYDLVGRIVSYAWNFGDNATGSGLAPDHVYVLSDPETPQTYTVTLTVTDEDAATGQKQSNIQVQINPDSTPPTVVSSLLNGGAGQRSTITTLSVQFSEAVIVTKGDLTLYDDTHDVTVNLSAATFNYDSGTKTATWNLSAVALENAYYTASLSGTTVTDQNGNRLDGDGNGSAGGDHLILFHRLAGDCSGDAVTNGVDLGILAANFGGTGQNVPGDLTGDGVVNGVDLGILAANFNASLPPRGGGGGGGSPPMGGQSVPLGSGITVVMLPDEPAPAGDEELAGGGAPEVLGETLTPPSDEEAILLEEEPAGGSAEGSEAAVVDEPIAAGVAPAVGEAAPAVGELAASPASDGLFAVPAIAEASFVPAGASVSQEARPDVSPLAVNGLTPSPASDAATGSDDQDYVTTIGTESAAAVAAAAEDLIDVLAVVPQLNLALA